MAEEGGFSKGRWNLSRPFPDGVGVSIVLMGAGTMLSGLLPEKMREVMKLDGEPRLICCPCVGDVGSMSDDVRRAWAELGVVPGRLDVFLLPFREGSWEAKKLLTQIGRARFPEKGPRIVVIIAMRASEYQNNEGRGVFLKVASSPFFTFAEVEGPSGFFSRLFHCVILLEEGVPSVVPPRSVPLLRVKRFTLEEIQRALEGLPGHVGHKEGPSPDGGSSRSV